MLELTVSVTGLRATIARIDRAPAAITAGIESGLRKGMIRVHAGATQRLHSGQPLRRRTANLARSLFWDVERSAESFVGRVGYDRAKAIYGRIQELGGTIVPKRAKYLTIPIGQALTGNGVARFTARELLANPKAFGFRGAFVNPRQTAILGVNQDRSLEPLFALKTRVEIPARNPLAAALRRVRTQVIDEITAAVRAAIRGGRAG